MISWTPVVNSQVFGYWPIYITTTWYHQRYWCILKLWWHNFYYYTRHQPKTLFALPLLMMHFATALSVWITTVLPHTHTKKNTSTWQLQPQPPLANAGKSHWNTVQCHCPCQLLQLCCRHPHAMDFSLHITLHYPIETADTCTPKRGLASRLFPKVLFLKVFWSWQYCDTRCFWGKPDCGSSFENQELVQQNWISNV